MVGVLTWVSANERWPRALLGGRGVGGANQLVLGHLGVGFGELQPQGLRDLWIKPDPLEIQQKKESAKMLLLRKLLYSYIRAVLAQFCLCIYFY